MSTNEAPEPIPVQHEDAPIPTVDGVPAPEFPTEANREDRSVSRSDKTVLNLAPEDLDEMRKVDGRRFSQIAEEQETLAEEAGEHEEEHRDQWSNRMTFILASLGAAIGLGNVWRFPFLCYKNGGGAFLIPYVLCILFLGLPLLLLEMSLGQKFQEGSIGSFTRLNAGLKYFGVTMLLGGYIVVTYYSSVMSWAILYLRYSFEEPLPWSEDPAGFFYNNILGLSDGIENTTKVQFDLFICLFIVWVLVFLCVFQGVKSSGWVVYVTVPLPFVILFALLIRGVTLPGAAEGLDFYVNPDLAPLSSSEPWTDAASQIFFSLGIGVGIACAFASHNARTQKILSDAIIVTAANCLTSILGGFAVFSILGYLANERGVTVADLSAISGPGLVFIAFPEALALMPASQLFSVLFFITIMLLGIDSAFALTEAVADGVKDMLKLHNDPKKGIFATFCVCLVAFLISILFVTDGGLYWLDVVDHYTADFLFLPVGLAECICIGYLYNPFEHCEDMTKLTQQYYSRGWAIVWKYVSPSLLALLIVNQVIKEIETPYGGYPVWARLMGLFMALAPQFATLAYFLVFNYAPSYAEVKAKANKERQAFFDYLKKVIEEIELGWKETDGEEAPKVDQPDHEEAPRNRFRSISHL